MCGKKARLQKTRLEIYVFDLSTFAITTSAVTGHTLGGWAHNQFARPEPGSVRRELRDNPVNSLCFLSTSFAGDRQSWEGHQRWMQERTGSVFALEAFVKLIPKRYFAL